MDLLTVGLRIVHIVGGVLWVGGAALFFFYVEPTINKLGPDAEKFVDEMVIRRKVPVYFVTISTLTVIAGVILYWRNFGGINGSPFGLALGLGGLAAIVAWASGGLLIPRLLRQVSSIAGEMKAAGGPPSAELMGRMHATQERLRLMGAIDLALLAFAVIAMAVARYLG
jgi:uncharacterized membrane protein